MEKARHNRIVRHYLSQSFTEF